MKSTTRLTAGLGGALLAAGLLVAAPTKSMAQEVTLKLHHFLPAQANVPKLVLDVWADKVEKDSNNRIKIQRFPSMQLGGRPPELYQQAVDGIADIVWTLPGNTPGRFPRPEVFELPFMMTNAEAVSRAYWEMHEKQMKDADFRETKVLAVWVHGPGLFHSKRPVEKLDDLKGLKVRGPTRIITSLLGQLGATPVGMPIPQVPESLSKGVIDATVIPWEVTPALKVSELVATHTEFENESLYTTTFVLGMNKGHYEKMPADLKKVIDDNSGMELSAFAGRTQAGADPAAREIAVKRGNKMIVVPSAEVETWKKAAEPVVEGWVKEMDGKGISGKALLDEARALIAKYTK